MGSGKRSSSAADDGQRYAGDDAQAEIPRDLRVAPDSARAALKRIQWGDNYASDGTTSCPECDQAEHSGHTPTCIVGRALAAPCPCCAERDKAREELAAALAGLEIMRGKYNYEMTQSIQYVRERNEMRDQRDAAQEAKRAAEEQVERIRLECLDALGKMSSAVNQRNLAEHNLAAREKSLTAANRENQRLQSDLASRDEALAEAERVIAPFADYWAAAPHLAEFSSAAAAWLAGREAVKQAPTAEATIDHERRDG